MLYLTYNDAPSGIYFSQVTDVCHYLREKHQVRIRLVAMVSVRNFWSNRKKIKSAFRYSIVLPMFPKAKNWQMNIITLIGLCIFIRTKGIIARGPFAASLALSLRRKGLIKRVCFDARGAYRAELNEYDVVRDERIKREIAGIEKEVIHDTDFRLAVSQQLVKYWRDEYGYTGLKHVIIPCTLHSGFAPALPVKDQSDEIRKQLGVTDTDILLVYSGSSAGWQSFTVLDSFLYRLMDQDPKIKVIFLAKVLPDDLQIFKFKNRVQRKWVNPHEVDRILMACDYGLLIRENSVTNKVSSPTKFAEYLAAGLQVIISEEIGDYSQFVVEHQCGQIVFPGEKIVLSRLSETDRRRTHELAVKFFSKSSYNIEYGKIVSNLEDLGI